MDAHLALRDLVTTRGARLLTEPATVRGVLEDVLTEAEASSGEVNLLVDAVRFAGLQGLLDLLGSGANPQAAVEEAGRRLARERGGDAPSATWAVAVLGHALGRLPAAAVTQYGGYRAVPPSAPAPPPMSSPPAPGWGSVPGAPPAPAGSWPSPGAPTSVGRSGSVPGAPMGPSSAAPTSGGRGRRLALIGGVVALVAAIGVVAVVVTSSGGDGSDSNDAPPLAAGSAVSSSDVATRYAALGSTIGTGLEGCEGAAPTSGEREVVTCDLGTDRVRLVRYADAAALDAARRTRLDRRAGTVATALPEKDGRAPGDIGPEPDGVAYRFDPDKAGTSDPAIVYWDDTSALRSITLTGGGDATIDELMKRYDATDPATSFPEGPSDPLLVAFVEATLGDATCTRQPTFSAGETEESGCESGTDGITVTVGRYAAPDGLQSNRAYYAQQSEAASRQSPKSTWVDGDGPVQGAYHAFSDAGSSTLYWDSGATGCNCFAVAYSDDDDLEALQQWWRDAGQ